MQKQIHGGEEVLVNKATTRQDGDYVVPSTRRTETSVRGDILLITEDQAMEAFNRVGNVKALGLDGIPNIALKATTKVTLVRFMEVYNTYRKKDTFCQKWKHRDWYFSLKRRSYRKNQYLRYRFVCNRS